MIHKIEYQNMECDCLCFRRFASVIVHIVHIGFIVAYLYFLQSLNETTQFLFRVENPHREWTTRHEFAGPFHFDVIVAGFGWIILKRMNTKGYSSRKERSFATSNTHLAQNGPILLTFALHLHSERTFWSANSHGELPCTRSACIANKSRLKCGQHTMLDAGAVHTNLYDRNWNSIKRDRFGVKTPIARTLLGSGAPAIRTENGEPLIFWPPYLIVSK